MSKKATRIRKIAHGVRVWAESLVASRDEELVPWGADDDLGMMCAISSYRLFTALKKAGLKPAFAANDEHAFVICDGWIVDVTATQFGHSEKVAMVMLDSDEADKSWWLVDSACRTDRELVEEFKNWETDQLPYEWKQGSKAAMLG